jgi:Type II secretion system (T2SS), protein E, N-terminal domain
VGSGILTAGALKAALATQPTGVLLGQHLVRIGQMNEDSVYEALSFQQGLPIGVVDVSAVPKSVAHALPEHVVREWGVLPFRVGERSLFVASAKLPAPALSASLRSFTALEIRFHLVTPSKFETLTAALL